MTAIKVVYFRKQAETCLRLAAATSDEHAAARLKEMAVEFIARANEMEMIPPRPKKSE
jgi:hypothetical protein